MIYQQFYTELGKLLYAVANADGSISKKEINALHDMVKNELVPVEKSTDSYGTDAAYYAEFAFDFLEEEKVSTENAFNSFIDFVEEHHTAFDEKLKKVCVKLAEKLAEVHKGTCEKEKQLLKTLKSKLKSMQLT